MTDPINPSHYTTDPSGIECIEITRHRNFNVGNAIKYLWRAGLKDDSRHVEDLKKAIFYIEEEIDRLNGKSSRHVRSKLSGYLSAVHNARGHSFTPVNLSDYVTNFER